ncbi:inositol phosphorylceramide synthase [Streptomyces antnestii]|uniref:Inositol phosphorylceramide synthase n=1 Tax=Streptomyces antnestii TaxID=2494256 RepID=A0A437Q2W0_9ACTN|nr:phosphatase PAP2 family protein [Streptomyces sp. San01]RVU28882.1 inositol phosphorylceramide synthase [Streptomyces sp. San01]
MNSLTEPAEPEPDTAGRETDAVGHEPDAVARPPLVRELLLVVGLFLVYKSGRQLANGHTGEAFDNAHRVWDLERAVHLPGEAAVQHALLHSDTFVHLANTYYATVHFPATVAFLVWLHLRRPRHYIWTRRVLAALTAAALALHLTFPLAPPRMLDAAHLVDTGQVYGPSVYGATPQTDSMANQFAAMPSLHFGWALMVAVGLIAATRSRWRWLWLLHPLLTLLVVIGTANHYWLDAIVATALLGIALAVIRLPAPAPAPGHSVGRHPLPAQRAAAPRTVTAESMGAATPAPWAPAYPRGGSLSASEVLARIPVSVTRGSASAVDAPPAAGPAGTVLAATGAHR